MEFDWDDTKARRNLVKHRVSFEEATTVFDDARALLAYDEDHSEIEERFRLMGLSSRGRLLIVTHTNVDEAVRIISARKATKQESLRYEQSNP